MSTNYVANSTLRENARNQLKGHWGAPILVCLIIGLFKWGLEFIFGKIDIYHFEFGLNLVPSTHLFSVNILIDVLLFAPLYLGLAICFLKFIRVRDFDLEDLFKGFSNYVTSLIAQVLMTIFMALWTLLLIIPGIIAGIKYSMTFYIIADNPEISALDAIDKSKKMMDGHKWDYFCLQLSFIGWAILSIITCGIGFIWLVPYVQTSNTYFYENIKETEFNL
ncbi:DUF975 family protein [Clostridium ihumii]|uniref:DUF975 family protein n=1 Tax=Clostridium ihumii TaxID=1470356 RepID=UPI000590A7D4|nr:DUF975 family protein [Clostridium ihumii]